jgi:hypothetical protein
MRFTFGNRPPYDQPDDHEHSHARREPIDERITRQQKQVAASLLEGAARLAEKDHHRLRLDMMDIAVRVLESDLYACWPQKAGTSE